MVAPMRLWLVELTADEPWRYDEYGRFVVAARDEAEAREVARGQATSEQGTTNPVRWLDPSRTTCVPLRPGREARVIVADFKAG